jgi:hypothetical protein
MTSEKVWVQLRGSQHQAFRVDIVQGALIDDVKIAINQRESVRVEFIFTEEDGEGSLCKPSAFVNTHGPAGRDDETPYYYTTSPPGM